MIVGFVLGFTYMMVGILFSEWLHRLARETGGGFRVFWARVVCIQLWPVVLLWMIGDIAHRIASGKGTPP